MSSFYICLVLTPLSPSSINLWHVLKHMYNKTNHHHPKKTILTSAENITDPAHPSDSIS
ncbi:hypothetical protein [Niallia oryzisoli]|uniref:hypothetical protein n=1 Tax=Niallia oryzisoli TaxID=1737571 RepID=UPI0037350653